jgi:hypothetical protein
VQKLRRGSHYTLQRAATLFVIAKVPKQVCGPLINDSPAVQILALNLLVYKEQTYLCIPCKGLGNNFQIHAAICLQIYTILQSAIYGVQLIKLLS